MLNPESVILNLVQNLFGADLIQHLKQQVIDKVISMKTSITTSLLTSLCQREEINPSLAKRGEGRFFKNDALLMNSLV